jgi:hypothetical protein
MANLLEGVLLSVLHAVAESQNVDLATGERFENTVCLGLQMMVSNGLGG